ncbi:hypothetical protein SAMN02745866_01669 [Alteromonadaceae bacterium Bs31]|nr:hypothetical protein SAMN02745866_01669 [Alteromonadaceae bacterium Bs31]
MANVVMAANQAFNQTPKATLVFVHAALRHSCTKQAPLWPLVIAALCFKTNMRNKCLNR